ncbi:MAG: hypothetical protein ACM3ZV_07985 [Bacillota bacterium]
MQYETTASEPQILVRNASEELVAADQGGAAAQDRLSVLTFERASSKFVRRIINARMMRRQFFDDTFFSDPAWDILLELYALQCEDHRISVSKLSVAADLPCTTALRWIDKLESECLVVRTADPLDGRRVWVALSDQGMRRMRSYVELVWRAGLPI